MTPIIWLSRHPQWMYKQKDKAISLSSLSVLNPPPRDWVMAVFKAYFDDSGNQDDPQEKVSSLAGYVATAEQWQYFEENWKKVLENHGVPYLHMKEFAPRIKHFKKYKDDEEGRIALLQSLIRVMSEAQIEGVASVINLCDLRYFNDRMNQNIDAYGYNLHTCMDIMSDRWPDTIIEMWLDRTNKLGPKIEKAKDYCKSEKYYGEYNDKIIPIPLPKGLNFINVVPIQAADLLAWEIRKHAERMEFAPRRISDWPKLPTPTLRKSLEEVFGLTIQNEIPVWNYVSLCRLPMFIRSADIHWYHQKLLEKAKKNRE